MLDQGGDESLIVGAEKVQVATQTKVRLSLQSIWLLRVTVPVHQAASNVDQNQDRIFDEHFSLNYLQMQPLLH